MVSALLKVAGSTPPITAKGVHEESRVPEVHMDYAFFRNSVGGPTAPVVVLKHKPSKALAAHVVPYKGGDHTWSVEQSVRDVCKWGLLQQPHRANRSGGCAEGLR